MTLLSESKSRPHTCSAIIGRVSTRPALRTRYSRSAYSRVVSSTRRPPRDTVRVAGSGAVGGDRAGVPFPRAPLADEARALPLILGGQTPPLCACVGGRRKHGSSRRAQGWGWVRGECLSEPSEPTPTPERDHRSRSLRAASARIVCIARVSWSEYRSSFQGSACMWYPFCSQKPGGLTSRNSKPRTHLALFQK